MICVCVIVNVCVSTCACIMFAISGKTSWLCGLAESRFIAVVGMKWLLVTTKNPLVLSPLLISKIESLPSAKLQSLLTIYKSLTYSKAYYVTIKTFRLHFTVSALQAYFEGFLLSFHSIFSFSFFFLFLFY